MNLHQPKWVGPVVTVVLAIVGAYLFADLIGDAAGLVGLISTQQLPTPSAPPTATVISTWDIMRSAISLLALAALAWTLFRSKTASIYKEELDAQRQRVDRLQRDHEETTKVLQLKETEVVALRTRTDLTKVIEGQQQLMAVKQEHDAMMMKALHDINVRGEQQYATAMDTLTKTLNYLAEAARTNIAATSDNKTTLGRVLDILERRWGDHP